MSDLGFSENAVSFAKMRQKDEDGFIHETDMSKDPLTFLCTSGWSSSAHNFNAVFNGVSPLNGNSLKYTFVLSDEDPLDAYINGDDLPGIELSAYAPLLNILPANMDRTRWALKVGLSRSNLDDDVKQDLLKLFVMKDSNITRKIWLILELTDDRPAQIRGASKSYCEFLYTGRHVKSFAPIYRYVEKDE